MARPLSADRGDRLHRADADADAGSHAGSHADPDARPGGDADARNDGQAGSDPGSGHDPDAGARRHARTAVTQSAAGSRTLNLNVLLRARRAPRACPSWTPSASGCASPAPMAASRAGRLRS